MTIYADTYAALNFGVNYLILLSTARISGAVYGRLRLALGALAGALYALACAAVPMLDFLPFKLGMAFCIVWTALGRDRLVKRTALFFASSFAVGGGVWALYLMTGRQEVRPAGVMLCTALCCQVLKAGFRLAGGSLRGGTVEVELLRRGRSVTLKALVDTGNRLTGEQGNLPVIVCEREKIYPLLTEEEQRALGQDDPLKVFELMQRQEMKPRLLPCRTVSGTALIAAFRPDAMAWSGGRTDRVLVGVCPGKLSAGGEFTAVVGSWIREQGGTECSQC